MVSKREPWTIVTRENNNSVFEQMILFQRLDHFAYGPVYFFHDIPKHTGTAFAFKFFGNAKWDMNHGMG
ncbi:hypothetical protein D3C72_2070500 [compost metagenome]